MVRRFALALLTGLLLWGLVGAGAAPARPLGPSAVLAAEPGGVQPSPIIKQAYDLLLDEFVLPPHSADLLTAGWSAAVELIGSKGGDVSGVSRPEFRGRRDAVQPDGLEGIAWSFAGNDFATRRQTDWWLFVTHYPELVSAAAGAVEPLELDRAIVAAMARSVDEGHTYYMTPDQFAQTRSQTRNDVRLVGVGIRFNRDLVIIEVIEGSPAEKAGLRAGDQLIAVEGESVEGLAANDVAPRVRGEVGVPVRLTLRRAGVAEPVEYSIVRAEVRIEWMSFRVIDGDIGYLLIRNFPTPDALDRFRRALNHFKEVGVRGVIIDVRANGGGVIVTGLEVISSFVRSGPVLQQVDRNGGTRTVYTTNSYWGRDVPIAVLVDNGSGSMSEILASALQENGVAKVIGTRTAGVVSATIYHQLADGSGLAVTVRLVKSGLGRTLDRVGVEPDLVVELDPEAFRFGRDSQRDAALEYLRQAGQRGDTGTGRELTSVSAAAGAA